MFVSSGGSAAAEGEGGGGGGDSGSGGGGCGGGGRRHPGLLPLPSALQGCVGLPLALQSSSRSHFVAVCQSALAVPPHSKLMVVRAMFCRGQADLHGALQPQRQHGGRQAGEQRGGDAAALGLPLRWVHHLRRRLRRAGKGTPDQSFRVNLSRTASLSLASAGAGCWAEIGGAWCWCFRVTSWSAPVT